MALRTQIQISNTNQTCDMYTLSVYHLPIVIKAEWKGLFLIFPPIHPPGRDLSIIFLSRSLSKQDQGNKLLAVCTDGVQIGTATPCRHWDSGSCDVLAPFLPGAHWPVRETVTLDAAFFPSLPERLLPSDNPVSLRGGQLGRCQAFQPVGVSVESPGVEGERAAEAPSSESGSAS